MPVIQNGDEIFEKFLLISVCEHRYYLKMLKNKKSKIVSLALYRLEISIYCLPRNFNWFPFYFVQCSFTKIKSTLLNFKTSSYQKIFAINYL